MSRVETRLVERDEPPFPGIAHVTLDLADGRVADLWDKEPVIGILDGVQVGDAVLLDCEVLHEEGETVTVRLAHGIVSPRDEDTFVVARALLR